MSTEVNTSNPAMAQEGAITRFFRATEIDTRMLGMVAAIFVVWCIFDIWSGMKIANEGLFGGSFLTPRNLWTLLVQTASIAIMATGMVLIIVMRHIDLSVGSLLTLVAVIAAVLQVQHLGPGPRGRSLVDLDHRHHCRAGRRHAGRRLQRIPHRLSRHSVLHRHARRPHRLRPRHRLLHLRRRHHRAARQDLQDRRRRRSGLLARTVLELDAGHHRLRRHRRGGLQRPQAAHALPLPAAADVGRIFIVVIGSAVVLGATLVVNSYPWPPKLVEVYALANQMTIPPGVEDKAGQAICMAGDKVVRCTTGLIFYTGYAVPVLIAIAVGLVMTFIATRTQFGRYVYAIGGNPEAAELAGINTKWMTVKVFALMGFLASISAIVASARLDAATVSLGDLNELYVIAAAVIGGTSLAGGLGTIYGAMLGALLMQSIASGMQLLNLPSAWQNIVVGSVLVVAVFVDQIYRRRVK